MIAQFRVKGAFHPVAEVRPGVFELLCTCPCLEGEWRHGQFYWVNRLGDNASCKTPRKTPKAPESGPRLVVVASDARKAPKLPFIRGRFVARLQRSLA